MPSNSKSSLALGLTLLSDSVAAAVASLWPWSTAAVEARRLRRDGHLPGAVTDVYYLVSFDEPVPDAALAAIRLMGFTLRETARSSGYVTVRSSLRLSAYDLTLAGARLDRTAGEFGGFATLIGAAQPASDEPARAAGAGSRRFAAM